MSESEGITNGKREDHLEGDEPDEPSTFRYQITAYGADYPVDALVKRISEGDIVIPTFDPEPKLEEIEGFQRDFVWTKKQSDKFIDSLLLGFPVPGIFLVRQADHLLLVLDGQQRLRTLQCFYGGILRGKEYALDNVQPQFLHKTYRTLNQEDRRRLDNSIIHATVVRQEEPSNDQSSVYMVFERLNTGGTTLQPQEIRVALYAGPFIKFLRQLNQFAAWRKIYGATSRRFKDQELILRFFALLYTSEKYQRPMKDFLNDYANDNRYFQKQSENEMKDIFEQTISTVFDGIGQRAFRLKAAINVAVMDSIMVGIANRILKKGPITDTDNLRFQYQELISCKDFISSVESGTTDEANVKSRLKAAQEAMLVLE